VGRSPNLLEESVVRGWISSRRVRTFEDVLIVVLDVERCLQRLTTVDRQIIQPRLPPLASRQMRDRGVY
jgi:hypothetical protein